MDCNKEEAFKAKNIAEQKLQTKDFTGARRFALKAQQLYSDIENISQILMVCDVHCASEKKVANEMDWYAILQVERSADESMIKKQYRKFALLLHPDKNKFPGAESAFKLIGEAQRVLLDKDKRHLHNLKRGAFVSKPPPPYRPPQRPPFSQNVSVQTNYTSTGFNSYSHNATGFNFSQPPRQASQPRASNGRKTFWTACPFCNVKYEYHAEVMNKSLICQTCSKPFVAYERFFNSSQPTVPQRKDVPSQGFTKVELNSSAKHPKADVFQRKVDSSEVGSQKVNGKRRRKKDVESEESSERTESEISVEDEEFTVEVDLMSNGEQPRRSDRRKQRVSYNENEGDVETNDEVLSDDENDPSASGQENIEIPDPEFFDFDSFKCQEKFEVGQIWSLYSDEDGLPKYYAEITKVSSPFKVRLRWLDSSGLPDNAIQWKDEEMPVCCGRFEPRKGGQNFTTKDPFSHRLAAEPTDKKQECVVMPKKGQIWGLYRNWTPKMEVSGLKNCQYDVVEVIEETGDWIEVEYLEQVVGFNSVFKGQMKEGPVVREKIPVVEILRFSHQIPAFKLTDEKNGSLRGFWELDPAALPVYYFAH